MQLAFVAKLKLLAELALGEAMKKLAHAAKLRSGEAISLAVGDYSAAVILKSEMIDCTLSKMQKSRHLCL